MNTNNYDVTELKRFAVRLEEQVSNARLTCQSIYEDMVYINNVFQHSYYDQLDYQSREFCSFWYNTQAQIQTTALKLSASILGFYDATNINQISTTEGIQNLQKKFEAFYKANPNLNKKSGATAGHQYNWTKPGQAKRMWDALP